MPWDRPSCIDINTARVAFSAPGEDGKVFRLNQTALPCLFFPSTSLQLSSTAKPLLSDLSLLLTSSQKDAEPSVCIEERVVPVAESFCSAQSNSVLLVHDRAVGLM